MALDTTALVNTMVSAGENLGSDLWNSIETFAVPELQKIAVQIVAIEENILSFTPEGAKALLDMQLRASVGVIVAMTTLTLLAVQKAINEILAAVQGVVNVLLMNSFLEQGDYKRAQDLLNEFYNLQKANRPNAAASYAAVAGQVIKGSRNRVERYDAPGWHR